MANNYCELSAKLNIPEDKMKKAEEIVDRVIREIEDDDGYCEVQVEIEKDGVWFHHDESANPDHVEPIAKALVEELDINEPFYYSWSYTCSKPRLDEFGGGACAVSKGMDSYWIDAMSDVMAAVKEKV